MTCNAVICDSYVTKVVVSNKCVTCLTVIRALEGLLLLLAAIYKRSECSSNLPLFLCSTLFYSSIEMVSKEIVTEILE